MPVYSLTYLFTILVELYETWFWATFGLTYSSTRRCDACSGCSRPSASARCGRLFAAFVVIIIYVRLIRNDRPHCRQHFLYWVGD